MDNQNQTNQTKESQNQSANSVKSSAKTVEEAIDNGLNQLNLSQSEVEIEIISEGSRGLFGLGAEEAEVIITPKADNTLPEQETPPSEAPPADEPQTVSPGPENSDNPVEAHAVEILQTILDKMFVSGSVSVRTGEDLVEPNEAPPMVLDITGPDLGVLIGRRGETLRALQFIVRQILNKEAGQWVPVVVDVESYLVRRRKSLQQLANRMAEKAVSSNRPVYLEPMTAHERRIIHLELRNNDEVETNSVGEGEKRKVVITPK